MKITRPFCVYAHAVDGEIIYIGSGSHARAFTTNVKLRSDPWAKATHQRDIDVIILSEHWTRAEAYEHEWPHIAGLQPKANQNGKTPNLSKRGLKLGRPPKIRPKEGAFIYCRSLDVRCPTLEYAASLANCSVAAVSRALDSGQPIGEGLDALYFVLAWD